MKVYIARGVNLPDILNTIITGCFKVKEANWSLYFHGDGGFYDKSLLENADACIMYIANSSSFGKGLFKQIMTCKHQKKPLYIITPYINSLGEHNLYAIDGLATPIEKLAGENFTAWGKLKSWGSIRFKKRFNSLSDLEYIAELCLEHCYKMYSNDITKAPKITKKKTESVQEIKRISLGVLSYTRRLRR